MIKFFRKIRQKMLTENKFSKYLIYAIGEIILVVIGILIALQINNWNEKQKLNTQQQILLKSIKQDLLSDSKYLKDFLTQIKLSNQILLNQSDRVNQTVFNKDSLINFVKNDIDITYRGFDGFNNNSYESLKTSGKIDVINESIKNHLFELSVLQKLALEEYDTNEKIYIDGTISLNSKYPVPIYMSFIKNENNYDFIWQDIDEKDLAVRMNNWGFAKANFFRVVLQEFNKSLDKTEYILNLMDN
jgi:hypothetical protein